MFCDTGHGDSSLNKSEAMETSLLCLEAHVVICCLECLVCELCDIKKQLLKLILQISEKLTKNLTKQDNYKSRVMY